MVFSLSSDTVSQELAEVNTISRKLFSHFIQIPSVAIQIKDIMLFAPAERRLQLQDMVRASVSQGQITVPVATSAHSEQNIQDSCSKNPGSTSEASDCVATHGNNDNEVVDDDWDDDWDAFQSLPAIANDGVDSGEISLTTRYNEQIPQENSSYGSCNADITARAMEDITCVDKELEEPSDLQFSSTEQQPKHDLPGSSHEGCAKLERHPSVDCKEQLADDETADELQQQVHEDTDHVNKDSEVLSAEIHGVKLDILDEDVEDDSPMNSNNLSDIAEEES